MVLKNTFKQRECESMEEQFLNFVSDDLLNFCFYGTHKHNYSAGSALVSQGLDALTNLSSKNLRSILQKHRGITAIMCNTWKQSVAPKKQQ